MEVQGKKPNRERGRIPKGIQATENRERGRIRVNAVAYLRGFAVDRGQKAHFYRPR